MSNPLKILFIPMDAIGHINSCLGIANAFIKCGHEVVFAIGKDWVNFIKDYGIKTEVFNDNDNESNDQKTWSARWIMSDENISYAEKEAKLLQNVFSVLYNQTKCRHDELKKKIEAIKPDIIILDVLMSPPSVETSGIPWIYVWSANPIRMYYPHCPPSDSGYPTDSDPKLWNEFQSIIDEHLNDLHKEFFEWFKLKGAILNSNDFLNTSPYLNVYIYPQYLDYKEIAPISKSWYRLDHAIRDINTSDMDDIPEEFLNTSNKKIFLSLGTLGSADLKLMNKLIEILANYPAKIFISKGPKGDEILMKSNMWGKNSLKQLKILPLVDLVISHGGNNTVVESLYFGKPLIVIPLFGDQPDNAQRLVEKNLGIRLDRYNINEEILFDAINKMLYPEESVKLQLAKISDELQKSTRLENLVKLIEQIASEKRSIF